MSREHQPEAAEQADPVDVVADAKERRQDYLFTARVSRVVGFMAGFLSLGAAGAAVTSHMETTGGSALRDYLLVGTAILFAGGSHYAHGAAADNSRRAAAVEGALAAHELAVAVQPQPAQIPDIAGPHNGTGPFIQS